MNIGTALLAALVGYLAGTISFTRLIARFIIPDEDISSTEFDVPNYDKPLVLTSVSPTALSKRKGPKAGCSASILDMLKAAFPTFIFMRLFPDQPYFLIAAATAIVGHNWPVQHQFAGGRGLSPMIGGLFIIDFWSLPFAFITGNLLGLGLMRDVVLAYIGFTAMLIPYMLVRFFNHATISVWWFVGYAVWATAVFLYASRSELSQYIKIKRSGALDDQEDFIAGLEETDMGRPIKYMRKYGFFGGEKK